MPSEKDGTCCSCGDEVGREIHSDAAVCLKRKDKSHCVHWWEGSSDDHLKELYEVLGGCQGTLPVPEIQKLQQQNKRLRAQVVYLKDPSDPGALEKWEGLAADRPLLGAIPGDLGAHEANERAREGKDGS